MRFTEIKVGGEYYFDRGRDWLVGSYYLVYRAVVVDSKRYRFSDLSRSWREDPKGNAVRCDLYRPEGEEKVRQQFVAVAGLRGDWEPTKAMVDANKRRRGEERRARQEREEQQRDRADRAAAAAKAIGVSTMLAHHGCVEVPAGQLLAMVTALAASGWKYEGVPE